MLPISGVGAAAPITAPTFNPTTSATQSSTGTSFLDQVQALTDNANSLAGQVATGQLQDIGQFTSAAAESSLAVGLTSALQNKAVEAYNSIMSMQV